MRKNKPLVRKNGNSFPAPRDGGWRISSDPALEVGITAFDDLSGSRKLFKRGWLRVGWL